MKSKRQNINRGICAICGKKPVSSYNRPKSLHKTKRIVKPNLQKHNKQYICTRCLRQEIKA